VKHSVQGLKGAGIRLALTGLALLLACDGGARAGSERSERERDSLIGESRLPGAGAVRGSMKAGDAADSRRALEDSIATAP
jgi:hypothetical protein